MRDTSPQKSITWENLINKLSYLQQKRDADWDDNDRLRDSLNRLSYSLKKYARTEFDTEMHVPKSSVIDGWISGDMKIAREELPFLLSWLLAASPETKASYLSEQLQTYDRLKEFLDENSPKPTVLQRNSSLKAANSKVVEVGGAIYGLKQAVDDAKIRLASTRPNSDEGLAAHQVAVDLLNYIEIGTQEVHEKFEALLASQSEVDESELSVLHHLGDEFKDWLLRHKPELVDAAMRITPACAYLSALSMIGATMSWATPVVLALCGGGKIIEIIKGLQKAT